MTRIETNTDIQLANKYKSKYLPIHKELSRYVQIPIIDIGNTRQTDPQDQTHIYRRIIDGRMPIKVRQPTYALETKVCRDQ